MGLKQWLFILVMFAYVRVPMGIDKRFEIVSFTAHEGYYRLILANGGTMWAPIMFTVIEERP